MCDTLAALPGTTRDGGMIFAKSADCEVNEANALVRFARRPRVPGETVRATHLVIPQGRESFEVLLTKAFWTYGCEVGVNEFGLCMGEEAVFTTGRSEEKDGLVGPDLMRIALERTRTCREAMDLIVGLLEEYGQGGSAELKGNSHFDSSFLMADPAEAWILETAGRGWAARQVRDTGSISNMLGIRTDWDRCSPSAAGAQEGGGKLDWAARYGLPDVPAALGAPDRQRATSSALARAKGRIDARTIFDIMRHHGEGYHPATAAVHSGVCIHAGPQKDRWWQADGVMVADVKPGDILVWVTGTSGNCVSLFKPVFMGVELPDIGPVPTETADARSLWWRHEQLHRRAMAHFDAVVPEIRADFDALEESFLEEAPRVRSGTPALKKKFSEDCFRRAWQATEKWIARLAARGDLAFADPAYAAMWEKMNAAAGLTGLPAVH